MPADLAGVLRAGLTSEPTSDRPSGIEIRQDLAPAGGLPVQPPSYEGPLEIHPRYVDGEQLAVIELDSVGSSANRLEEVLLELHRAGRYPLPVSSTTVAPPGAEQITITTLEMPHRVFDAWLRLSASNGGKQKFEDSPHGRELSMAHAGALDALLETSSHDLLFGVWDSHRKGPHGQVRIGRSLTTTLLGIEPLQQAQFAARRDPLNLGEASDLKGAKKLSEQGLSSIPPQKRVPYSDEAAKRQRVESYNGGVSIKSARYLGFLSFAALRRLGFQRYAPVDVRVLLASLGLYAVVLRSAGGWDLRARCALTTVDDLRFALVGPHARREEFTLSLADAEQLFEEAVGAIGIDDRSVQLSAGETLNAHVGNAIASGKSSD